MLIYYGDKLFALAIDGRDVVSVFGRVEGPSTLLQMQMWTMRLWRLVGRGHREAGNRRCRDRAKSVCKRLEASEAETGDRLAQAPVLHGMSRVM